MGVDLTTGCTCWRG